jgi:talin
MVAGATHSLCESANTMVQGNATEEKLIASAKEVAGSTAALLIAIDHESTLTLQATSKAAIT